jgi:Sugar phosphate permease
MLSSSADQSRAGQSKAEEGNERGATNRFMSRRGQSHAVTDVDGSSSHSSVRSARAQLGVVAGASVISVGLGAYEIAPASVTPLVRETLNIGTSAAGLLVGVMFGAAVVASLPVGAALDRTDSRTAVALAVAALLVAGGLGWVAASRGSFLGVLASRFAGGVAYVVVWNAGIDIVSEAVQTDNRATAVGVFTASGPVGFALGQGAGPTVATHLGWPAVLVAFNALSLVGLVLFWPASRGLGSVDGGGPPSLDEFRTVFRDRGVWLVATLGFLGYSLYLSVNSWAPSYLTEEIGVSLALSGVLVAGFPAVGVVSRVSGGVLSDYLFDGRRRPVVVLSFLAATPFVVGFAVSRSLAVLVVSLLGAGFAVQLTLGLSFAYVRELVAGRVAATAVAFQTSVGLGGAFLAPIVAGSLIDTSGYRTTFLLAGALAAAGVALAWVAPEPGER